MEIITLPGHIVVLLFGILGLFIGSFLNVVIFRMSTGRSVVSGRSYCFSCRKALEWYELIPAISFIIQRGRCRKCKSTISSQYPVVELLTGVLFACTTYFVLGENIVNPVLFFTTLTTLFFLLSLSVVIAVYDYKHLIIPLKPWVILAVVALLSSVFVFHNLPLTILFGLIACALPFACLHFFSKGTWMGFGDVLIAVVIGILLGVNRGLTAILISFWIGAIVSIVSLVRHKKKMSSVIPFGPFLLIGLWVVFFTGWSFQDIMNIFSFF